MKNLHLKIGVLFLAFIVLFVGIKPAKAADYGYTPDVNNAWKGPPTCTDAKPDKAPILLQPNHPALAKKPKKGEVVLYWHKVPGATGYNVYYGLSPKNYIYSAPDVGDTNNFTIGYLPNKIFYFAVQAKKGCAAGSLSQEWKARPGLVGSAVNTVLGTSTGSPIVKKITPKPVVSQTNVIPTAAPAVKGLETQNTNTNYQPPQQQYNPPTAPKAVQPVPPKPKGFFETILSILFGK